MNEISLLSAFVMGLVGSGHCLVMCGGVASSLQLAAHSLKSWLVSVLYNLGRASSYMLAGSLVATLGGAFAKQNTTFALSLKFLSGVFMLLVGIYVMRLASSLKWLESIAKTMIWQHLVKLNKHLLPVKSYPRVLFYGMLWGWLPCGLVYSALTWTLQANSALHGALIMLFFALGTLPAMVVVGQSAQHLNRFLNHNLVRLAFGSIFIWYGIYLLIIATDRLVH
ncbi:sulfite exporter TauE/SafE family protein [Pseudoalteromonas sp. S16_S37]|uniref:sulfite exporter TauE/SafE family protein n=1 Tax=Pseudoalteromonas sp. S16_S37 TaxID=2720228 RepID=UPI00167FEFD0|nr:sulfite exporter TauE/SafE family protein [Pseudoalteromonas sp. S16_S37]MBD1584357.1 sulfite exporter TauE/SafE family protein [Pseudoalteromonas sp. S16_S37]